MKDSLSLSERAYTYSECGIDINKNLNAAVNISRRAEMRRSNGDLAGEFGSVASDRGNDLNGTTSSVWVMPLEPIKI